MDHDLNIRVVSYNNNNNGKPMLDGLKRKRDFFD